MKKLLVFSIIIALVFMTMPARAVNISTDLGMYYYSDKIPVSQGNYYFVCSAGSADGAGSDGYDGTNPRQPLATIDAAINKCTGASTTYPGDVIVILPGHAETVDATTDLVPDTAGIYFIGLGQGDMRPTITINGVAFDSSPAISISGADCTFENIIFTSPYATEVSSTQEMIDVGADDITFKNCWFTITDDGTEDMIMADGANTADNLTFIDCYFSAAAGADSAIYVDDVQANLVIKNCRFIGDYDNAPIFSDAVCTNILIENVYAENVAADQFAIEFSAATTGFMDNVLAYTDDAATAIDPGSLKIGSNVKISMSTDLPPIPFPTSGDKINAGIIDVYVQSGSDTTIVSEALCGYPNDYFNYGWTVKYADSDGTGINVDVTDFVAATGTLTVDSMSETPAAGDRVILSFNPLMSDVVSSSDLTNEVPDGSVLSYILDDAGDTSNYDDTKHSLYAIGTDTDAIIATLTTGTGLPYIMATQDSATDTTSIIDLTYAGYGNDFFNTGWVATCLLNADSVSNAPEGQTRDITDYDSTTGDFTTAAFGAAIGTGDKFFIYYDPLKATAASKDLTNYYPDGSAMSYILDDGGDTSGFDGVKHSLCAIGDDTDTLITYTDHIADASLPVDPTANSLAAFIASGGTALGTELAASHSIIDAIGSTGAALIDDAAGVAGQIGVNNADNAMDTSTVVGNQDGSVFERLEQMQRMQPQIAETMALTTVTGSVANIFTIAGGYVEILGIFGYITTAIPATACNTKLIWDPASGADTDLCAVLDIASLTQYSYLYLTGDVGDAMINAVPATDVPKTFQESTNGETMILGPGTIDLDLTASPDGGVIIWHLYYRIIEIGASVTPKTS